MATFKIVGECEGSLDAKRFRLPGVTACYTCPKCKVAGEKDFGGDDYLSYPSAGEPFKLNLYCDPCGHEWAATVKLTIKLEVA